MSPADWSKAGMSRGMILRLVLISGMFLLIFGCAADSVPPLMR